MPLSNAIGRLSASQVAVRQLSLATNTVCTTIFISVDYSPVLCL